MNDSCLCFPMLQSDEFERERERLIPLVLVGESLFRVGDSGSSLYLMIFISPLGVCK